MLDLLGAFAQPVAHGFVVGIHMLSLHSQATYPCDVGLDGLCSFNNTNPGLYVRTESGLTAGVYRNSYRDTSAYIGWTWETDSRMFAVTAAVATGYDRAPLMPALIPSVRIPLGDAWAARLSLIPKPSMPPEVAVAHLSIERRW